MVVIEYRKNRFFSPLLPPLAILVVAIGIMMYQRQTPLRPPAPARTPRPSAPAADKAASQGRVIMVDAADTGAAIEPIAVRTAAPLPLPLPAPAPPPVEPSAPDPAPAAAVAAAGPPPESLALAHAGRPAEPGPFAPTSPGAGGARTASAGPRLEPPAPLTSSACEPLSPDSPELAFQTGVRRKEVPNSELKVTKEEILNGIKAEAEQKKAEQDQLAREVVESKFHEFVAMRQKIDADRTAFHDDLRRALRELGANAGPEIKAICDRYGRDTHPVVEKTVRADMASWSARLTNAKKIARLRAAGLPEARIFDFLASELDRTMGTRGGPANRDAVRVRAAQRLLQYPPTAAPGAATAARGPTTP
jgi:hypothetical protein